MSQNSSPSVPGDSSSSGPGSSGAPTAPGQGFFDWLRRLGISRGDSWIGGVCGGIAARLGIDPIIVRGIAVVVALLGGPAFLLYALAWLLLPDTTGTIHLERLIRGTFEAASAGVIVFALLAFLPLAQGVWWAAGWPFGAAGGWTVGLGKLFWSAVVVAAIVLLIVWISRRSSGWGASPWAGTGTYSGTASEPTRQGSERTPSTVGAPTAPPPPVPDASPDALADWKARQAEWKTRYEQWKRQQADEARIRREQRSAEISADASRRQADAFELARIRRLTNPRTSGAYVAIALGAALIVGALAAATSWSVPALHHYQAAFGFAAATAVIGLSMVGAGFLRRRSGFLAFVAIVLTAVTALLLFGPTGHEIELRLPGSFTSFHY
ncbi:MAG: PspC protein [Frondihabitans sp.]|nr:PspC protein [Frondihabitans sp.]